MPKVAPGCDPTRLPLSPAEGYLLSRVDGRTPWSVLREIGGLSPSEVDRCLRSWLQDGLLEVGDGSGKAANGRAQPGGKTAKGARVGKAAAARTKDRPEKASASPAPAPATPPSGAADRTALDPSLDLSVEAQERILAFEARLQCPYHELLGVPRAADVKTVKRAYFELSKEFHPDRYFRRDLGPFTLRLKRVFERIAEAYELLSDPTTRIEVERTLEQSSVAAEPEVKVEGVGTTAQAAKRARAALHPAHLRQLALRKNKAKSFFESGMAAFQDGRWLEAAAGVRLAIAFDPANQAYKESFGAVQRKASDERGQAAPARGRACARGARQQGGAAASTKTRWCTGPTTRRRTSRPRAWPSCWGRTCRRAKEYAARSCELVPENGAYRRLLGQIYQAAGLEANARRELEAALRIDPKDAVARTELTNLA